MKRNSLLLNVFYLNIKNITYNKMQENFKFNDIALKFYQPEFETVFIQQKYSLHLNN